MGCGICGKLNKQQKDLVKVYRGYYNKFGKEYWVYKTSEQGDIIIVNKNQFNKIFETMIKPNLKNGADFAHIKEYVG